MLGVDLIWHRLYLFQRINFAKTLHSDPEITIQVPEDVQSSTADLGIITEESRMVLMPAKDQLLRNNAYPMLMNFLFWGVPSRLRLDSRMVFLPRRRFY